MILRGTVFSKTLEKDSGITIVTPSDLKQNGPYRVAYLLHGLCGDSATWVDNSMLPVYAREGHTIYILPDAVRSFYTDMRYGSRYFTYVTEELPVLCKQVFQISARREDTAVLGASMGGYGALKCALSRPEQYGMCGAFSSACLDIKEGLEELRKNGKTKSFVDHYGEQLFHDFLSIFGEDLEWKPEYDLLELARGLQKATVKPAIYMTCGSYDAFRSSHIQFQEQIESFGFAFQYEEWQGGHDFFFFDRSLQRAIRHFNL